MIRLSSQTIFTPRCFRSSFTDGEVRGQIRPSTFTAETANGRIVSICRGPRLAPRLASLHLLRPSWVYGSNPLQHLCLPFTRCSMAFPLQRKENSQWHGEGNAFITVTAVSSANSYQKIDPIFMILVAQRKTEYQVSVG